MGRYVVKRTTHRTPFGLLAAREGASHIFACPAANGRLIPDARTMFPGERQPVPSAGETWPLPSVAPLPATRCVGP